MNDRFGYGVVESEESDAWVWTRVDGMVVRWPKAVPRDVARDNAAATFDACQPLGYVEPPAPPDDGGA